MLCRQVPASGGSADTFNPQRPASRAVTLQPTSQQPTCFTPTPPASLTQLRRAAAMTSVVHAATALPLDHNASLAAFEGGAGTVHLRDVAGEMLLLRLALPLQAAPRFVQLPRWHPEASGDGVAVARGALDSAGLLYYAVRSPAKTRAGRAERDMRGPCKVVPRISVPSVCTVLRLYPILQCDVFRAGAVYATRRNGGDLRAV